MELSEDGTLRLWSGVGSLVPHDTAEWDLELTLTPAENGELSPVACELLRTAAVLRVLSQVMVSSNASRSPTSNVAGWPSRAVP